MKRIVLCCLLAVALAGCEREQRRFTSPPVVNQAPDSPYAENAYAVNQGKRLYRWFNCNGCHSGGGGGSMGPPLMDADWRYGSEPADIYATIMQGRPRGMPAFAGRIPEEQVWQIVAYVRSMSGQLRKDVAPSRSDTMGSGPPENARPKEQPRQENVPPNQPSGPKP